MSDGGWMLEITDGPGGNVVTDCIPVSMKRVMSRHWMNNEKITMKALGSSKQPWAALYKDGLSVDGCFFTRKQLLPEGATVVFEPGSLEVIWPKGESDAAETRQ